MLDNMENNTQTAEAHHLLAKSLLQEYKFDEAIINLDLAIHATSNYAEAYHTFALCLFAQGDVQAAITKAKAAINLIPEYTEAHFTLGIFFYTSKQMEKAIISYQKALTLKPDYVEAIHHLGNAMKATGNNTEAEKLYKKAIGLRPDYCDPYNSLGHLLRQLGRPIEAAASFRSAHSLYVPPYRRPSGSISLFFSIIKGYLNVALDLMRWSIKFKLSPEAWQHYQKLHFDTDGKSSEYVNMLMKKISRKKPSMKFNQSKNFPWVKSEDIPKISEKLEKDGIYIFDQLIEDSILDEIIHYANSTKATLGAPLRIGINGNNHFVINHEEPHASSYHFEEKPLLQKSVFQQFIADPIIHTITNNYFGIPPKFCMLKLWWNTDFQLNTPNDMSNLFHVHLSYIKWLKFFVYLTDVTPENGKHTYIRGSHKRDQEGRELRNRGLAPISDEDVFSNYKKENIIDVVGPRGTVFIEDTRGLHKSDHPKGHHRLIMELLYVNSHFPVSDKKNWTIPVKDKTLRKALDDYPESFSIYSFDLT